HESDLESENPKGVLRLWNVATGTQLHALEHTYGIWSVAFSPDGKTLVVGTVERGLHLWDAVTGKELRKIDKLNKVQRWILSPDGKLLAVEDNRTIRLLELSSGKELHTLTGHSSPILSLAFSPNGRLLASGSFDQTVRLWEVNPGQ